MKKAFIHQIIIEKEGFYVFERGVGYYHAFKNLSQVKLIPKFKSFSFYALSIGVIALFIVPYFIWSIDLILCLLLAAMYLLVLFRYYQNAYDFKLKDTKRKHVYRVKANAASIIDSVAEIVNRIKTKDFEKMINSREE